MHVVGVRELKNRLTHYLSLTRQGVPVIVTDRSEPIAVLHGLEQVEETAGTEAIDVSSLLPADRGSFRYEGSLTTPPCSEIVTWNVFVHPTELSSEEIEAFASLYPNDARPVQPLNRRFVLDNDTDH